MKSTNLLARHVYIDTPNSFMYRQLRKPSLSAIGLFATLLNAQGLRQHKGCKGGGRPSRELALVAMNTSLLHPPPRHSA